MDKDSVEKNAALFDIRNLKKRTLDENEIIAQAVLFFAVGYETTGTLLTWFFYQMALNQEVQQQLYEELHKAMDTKNEIDYDTLKNLPYLDATVSETLRICSPAIVATRVATEDYPLGDTGIIAQKGMEIHIPIYSIHHDPENYPDPEKFDPERFLPENRDNIKPYTYLPFGAGPRNCVGLRFALLEAKLAIAKVLINFKITRTKETPVPPNYKKGSFFLQADGIFVGVKKRSP